MNCKPGDLAVIVRSSSGNEGAIVRCLELVLGVNHVLLDKPGPAWRVDRCLKAPHGPRTIVMDCFLRPIRDPGEDAVDEMLQRLPAPSRDEVMA